MSNKTSFKTIEEFLYQENRIFVIPNYQRGYKWSVRKDDKASAVEKLCGDLINANKEQQYFLQGVTVVEEDKKIILIDGQQRTTTLYLLLWCLDPKQIQNINLNYDIRIQSKQFIHGLKKKEKIESNLKHQNQDINNFIEAIRQVESIFVNFENEQKKDFIDFVLNKVTILYITIEKDKATKTFTMMNGSKATMLEQELMKAEMLRKVSLPEIENKQVSSSIDENLKYFKELISIDWESNAIRSRYAREWDKWLYWWNREEVQSFFNTEEPIGLLLNFYYLTNPDVKNKKLSFEDFRGLLNENGRTSKQKTKLIFKELRDLQKSFEDIFNIPIVFNYLGMSLIDNSGEKKEIIQYFIINKHNLIRLKNYAILRIIGATHLEITKKDSDILYEKYEVVKNKLIDDFIYYNHPDVAFKQLIRLNIEEDNRLNRKFDFTIWQNKSLEHIYPKSKVHHKNEAGELVDGNEQALSSDKISTINDGTWLNRENFNGTGSEHCIGNLVLLYGKNNSSFGAKNVQEKKKTYFNISEKFESRHLLHTISVFSQNSWREYEIQQNKMKMIDQFEADYKQTINSK